MTYNAIIAKIYTHPTPNADKLLLGDVLGFQVLVGIDTPNGALGVYWPTDGQLSERFCQVHNLIGKTDPVTNIRTGGFFDERRRVKTLRLRKERSDGFWMPISCLDFTGDISHLKDGDLFTEINGIEICQKYITQATRNAMGRQQAKTKKVNKMFAQHIDTEQYLYNKEFIKLGSLITLTGKIHGTSGRIGNVLEDMPLSKLARLWNKIFWHFHVIQPKQAYVEIHGTRRVQLANIHSEGDGFYGTNFRDAATKQLQGRLKKGEVIYFEIVGWANDTPIMSPHNLNRKDHKELYGKYPDKMHYSYGCLPGENKIFIYRITQVNEDGQVTELSWKQVQRRSLELGVPTVVEYEQFIFGKDSGCYKCGCNDCEEKGTIESMSALIEQFAENHPDPLDSRHIREGVVIRVDSPDGLTNYYKYKSFHFKLLEGIIKNDETVVDMEESA